MEIYKDVIVRVTKSDPCDNSKQQCMVIKRMVSTYLFYNNCVPRVRNITFERKLAKRLHISLGKAGLLFLDLQKFVWMAARSDQRCIPPPLINDAWYEFARESELYQQFCRWYCGGDMPYEPHFSSEEEITDVSMLYPTIDLMWYFFGKKPSSNWDYVPRLEAQAA